MILRILPQNFDTLLISIEESKYLSKLSVYELMGSFHTHEHCINSLEKSSQEFSFRGQANARGGGEEETTLDVVLEEEDMVVLDKQH